jgi:lysophospholipase L1-like esterase
MRRRRVVRAALVLAVAVLITGCDYQGQGSIRVALFGDSVADDAAAETTARMAERYGYIGYNRRRGAIEDQLFALAVLLERDPPDVLVVELGVGDAQAFHDDQRMRDDIVRVLEAARGVPCVRWLTLKEAGVNPFYQGVVARSGAFNRVLAETIAPYPNAEPVDYDVWAQAHPQHYLADGLHFNEAGRSAYGHWLATRVAGSCHRR